MTRLPIYQYHMRCCPDSIYDEFNSGDTTLMAVFFDSSVSSDESMDAVKEIRRLGNKQCFVSGMSAFVTDLKDLAEAEEPVYVAIAVVLACVVLALFMDSWIIPLLFIAGIGMAILYNLGSNVFMGEISYITKHSAAVLQLGCNDGSVPFSCGTAMRNREERVGIRKRPCLMPYPIP